MSLTIKQGLSAKQVNELLVFLTNRAIDLPIGKFGSICKAKAEELTAIRKFLAQKLAENNTEQK